MTISLLVTKLGLCGCSFFFQMNGVIGNVQASNLILTVELTDNLFAVTQKSYVVQVSRLISFRAHPSWVDGFALRLS